MRESPVYCSCSLPHSVEEERLAQVKRDAQTQARFQVWLDVTNRASAVPPQAWAQLGSAQQLSGIDLDKLLGGGVVYKEMPKR